MNAVSVHWRNAYDLWHKYCVLWLSPIWMWTCLVKALVVWLTGSYV